MSTLTTCLVFGPATAMLLTGLMPTGFANRHVRRVRQAVTSLAGLQFLAATVAFLIVLPALLAGGTGLVWKWPPAVIAASLYYDGFAALMLTLVSFVGFIVCRYSIRYLDGEPDQGRFYRWVGMTIGAVSLVVLSGNLLMLLVAWMLTSFGLHQLLLHYPDRPAARRAAWTKFAISRVGDAMLIAAIGLVYREFGTLELTEVFSAVQRQAANAPSMRAIAWLFMLGAVTKSAQFPVHTWLPETMETPTPVSALMHAGIVNAGGYLVIRLSPILVEVPAALATLAIIGTFTVAYAGIVMLTQTSVKRSLAYSTIAQMGFMMLQCGLGAFSAAMLHILAHSLYKAHAFLNSGNVLTEAAGMRNTKLACSTATAAAAFIAALGVSAAAVVGAALVFGVQLGTKAGGFVLGFVLALALASWLADALKQSSARVKATGVMVTISLALLYVAGYYSVDLIVAASVPKLVGSGYLNAMAVTDVVVAFCGLLGIHVCVSTKRGRSLLGPMQVHAANGFYLDVITQRSFARLRAQ